MAEMASVVADGPARGAFVSGASNYYAGRTILVTGASGFIGQNLLAALRSVPCRILALGRRPIGAIGGVAEIQTRQCDLLDGGAVNAAIADPVDIVFHLAGQTSSKRSAQAPLEDLHANCQVMLTLLEQLRRIGGTPSVIFASTATTAGLTPPYPVDESFREQPISVYDIHKLTAEHYVRYYSESGFISGASLRLTNVYGAGSAEGSADRGILNKVITRALSGEPIVVYRPGNWLRDYTYVSDVVGAFLLAGKNADRLGGRPYFIGSGEGTTVKDAFALVIERVGKKTGIRSQLLYKEPPPSFSPIESRSFVANPAAFARETNWRPAWTLSAGIDQTVVDLLADTAGA